MGKFSIRFFNDREVRSVWDEATGKWWFSAKHYPNNRANDFLDWFVYSDSTIDGQSKKKAYTLAESGLLDGMKPGTH